MSNIDIASLSVAELESLKGSISRAILDKRDNELLVLRQTFEQMAADAGYTLEEILQAAPTKSVKTRMVKPKYQNPANTAQVWTGRGRKPGWVETLLGKGGSLDDCLIQ